jgi:hypothetical protein
MSCRAFEDGLDLMYAGPEFFRRYPATAAA